MGWCHEFGCQIVVGCDHPMTAGTSTCRCAECDVVCTGRFGGCTEVWERGPREVSRVDLRTKAVVTAPPIVEEVVPVLHEPAPQNDPAADVISWLRREFDDVHNQMRAISERLARQEALIVRTAGTQTAELNVSLAELEGCAAQLRNEAAGLSEVRDALADSLPSLVSEALGPAVTATLAGSVTEVRSAVTELGAALAEAVPAAVADAIPAALAEALAVDVPETAAGRPTPGRGDPAAGEGATGEGVAAPDDSGTEDPVSQLHLAQDEAAEWLVILVEEAVRRAVGEKLAAAAPTPAPVEGPVGTGPVGRGPVGGGNGDAGTGGGGNGSAAPEPAADTTAPAMEQGPGAPVAGAPVAGAAMAGAAMAGAPVAGAPEAEARPAGSQGAGAPPDPGQVSAVTCSLAGAAVGPTLALGVSAALRRARLLRRRRRQAGAPAAGLFRHDPFASDRSRELDRFALARGGLACNVVGADLPVAVGDLDGREAGVDLARQALAIVGEQADDAVRALALTVLAARPFRSVRLLVAGGLLPPNSICPGLDRVPTLDAALTELDTELDRRERGAGDGQGPAIVLVASGVTPADTARLDTILDRGRSFGVTGVIAGAALHHATTLTLTAGAVVAAGAGIATPLAGSRAFTLSPEAALEVVDVLTEAFTDDGVAPPVEIDEAPFPVLALVGAASVDVALLGAYRIQVGGTEIKSGLRAKARELLAFYLLHPEGTTLDAATEALWPEADPGRGSEWFWTALGNLRSLLRNAVGVKELKVIERDGDRYRVEPIFDVDLWRFQRALPGPRPSAAAPGDPEWATALSAAADLYGGGLLADVDWAWAEVPREDLRRRAVDVLVALAATRALAGDTLPAIDTLSRAVEVDPLAEQAYRRLMRCHAKLGHPDEVAATLRRLESRLAEVGLEPTPESVRLAAELAKEPSLAGTLPVAGG